MFNHALLKGGGTWWGKLAAITAPTLVIHGTEDPVLPLPHGEALAQAIPGARLVAFPGMGHEQHPEDWDGIAGLIAAHGAGV